MTSCKAFSDSDFATLNRLRGDIGRFSPFASMATQSGAGKRIVFTGGSGKAGRHVIPELLKRGYKVHHRLDPVSTNWFLTLRRS